MNPRNWNYIWGLVGSLLWMLAGCGGGSSGASDGSDAQTENPVSEDGGQNAEIGPEEAAPPLLHLQRISPTRGADTGGNVVILEGEGFGFYPVEVFFGGKPVKTINLVGDNVIVVATPEGVAGETVDVTVKNEAATAMLTQAYWYLSAQESEPNNQKGENDTFAEAQEIPLNSDVKAYIGELNDLDYFTFEVPEPGIISMSIDFTKSFAGWGIFEILLLTYLDEEIPWALTGVEIQSAEVGTVLQGFERSITPLDAGRYVMKVVSSPGDPMWGVLGYDPYNPYIVRVDFYPGPDLEAGQESEADFPIGSADTYLEANEIVFTEGSFGRAEFDSFLWYEEDFDWYKFTAGQNGWLRVTGDIIGFAPDPNDYEMIANYNLFTKNPTWQEIGGTHFMGDPPNSPAAVAEFDNIQAGETYYLRIVGSLGFSQSYPYHFVIEHSPGGVEDGEPGDSPKSDSEYQSVDLGELQDGNAVSRESYIWHVADTDFFKVRTPGGDGGMLCLKWNYQKSFDALGWRDSSENPLGLSYVMYLYDQAWYQTPDHPFGGFLIYVSEDDMPEQRLAWKASGATDYYLRLWGMYGIDQENPYTFTALFLDNAETCPP